MTARTSPRTIQVRLIGGVLAVAAALAAACSGSPSGAQAGAAKTKVTVAVPAASELFNLPVVLADRLGYYTEEGLEVELLDVGSGSKAVQAVLAGDAQAASGYIGNAITTTAKGQPLRAFVATMNSPGVVLAVSAATGRRITEVSDLKDAVVGVSSPGSGSHQFLNWVLRQHGLTPVDVSIASVGLAATAVAAMEHGKVDAAVMVDPAFSQLQRRAPNVEVLVDTRTADGLVDVFGLDDYPAMTLYARPAWLSGNEEAARKLVGAVTRALRWARQHNAGEIAEVMPAKYAAGDRALY